MNAQSLPGKLHSATFAEKFSALLLSSKGKSKTFHCTFTLSSYLVFEVCSVPRCHGLHQDPLAQSRQLK